MKAHAPYRPEDLAELDERLLDRSLAVVPMRTIHAGATHTEVIGMRHDVDNAIEPAVAFAKWEADRGYNSTYFVLHTAPYWAEKNLLRRALEDIASHGHEIGIHSNAIAASMLAGRDPLELLAEAIDELRGYGYAISGTVAHGDRLCYADDGSVRFVNDEIFRECWRPTIGEQGREIAGFATARAALADFGLDYDANWLGSRQYLSDSGGVWRDPGFDATADGFPFPLQTHLLIHPDWWGSALIPDRAPA